MVMSPSDRLRLALNEQIGEGEDESDTRFTDQAILQFLSEASGDPDRAAAIGWTAKAAIFADLITISEGNALRQMSDLHNHALAMVKQFSGVPSAVRGRARVGRIRRREWGW